MKNLTIALLLTLLVAPVSADVLVVETVTIGNTENAGNPVNADTGLIDRRFFKPGVFGAVDKPFRIATNETTNDQYVTFLNAVAKSDPNRLFDANMTIDPRGGIVRDGTDGAYSYSSKPNMGNKPVVYTNYFDALRFANWMHNGQPAGSQDVNSTEDGAYTLTNGTGTRANIQRNPGARWFLPSEDQWYKAAYYDPATAIYWDYPTASNVVPTIATADEFGNVANPGPNTVNYANGADWNGLDGNVTTVGSAGNVSAYGTYDQAGNVDEWTDTYVAFAGDGPNPPTGGDDTRFLPVVRGGTFFQPDDFHNVGVGAGTRDVGGPNGHVDHIGIRLATSVILGDFNQDGVVNFFDILPFISILSNDGFLEEGDLNQDGVVNFLDVVPFVLILFSE